MSERCGLAKTSKEYSEKFKTVQMRIEDKVELDRVHKKTKLSRVELLSEGIKMLKRKHRVKDEVDGDGQKT